MNTGQEKRWVLADKISPEANKALEMFPPVLRQILFNRDIEANTAALKFLSAEEPDQTDPFLLTDMEVAVDRVQKAIETGERIAVYGDYDADGVTATALMMQTLNALQANVEAYLPNRFEEGYGLNNDALDTLISRGVSLVITVDCGIRALEEAKHASRIGLDLIITDHHSPGPEIPDALAVINPKRQGDAYPEKNLAGVGTAYKVATALVSRIGAKDFDTSALLDLVALGTVADLVPLKGENRHLVRAGLEQLRQPKRQGLFSLMQLADIRPAQINAATIGFVIGPRLNAAGRLDSALDAYELLSTGDVMRAGQLSQQLDNQNRERRAITVIMQEKAESIAITRGDIPLILFAADESFNPGVVGLAASRLTEQYYRPAIIGERGEDTTRASCRSIKEFDITAALDQCADLLLHYGGHAAAAGFTVANENVDALIERLNGLAVEQLGDKDLRPSINLDAEVSLESLSLDLLVQLELLQPTGYGNPEPMFVANNVRVLDSRTVGRDGTHLKMTLSDGKKAIDAIAFRQGYWQEDMPDRINVVFQFEKNEFRGKITPQLNVRDIQKAA